MTKNVYGSKKLENKNFEGIVIALFKVIWKSVEIALGEKKKYEFYVAPGNRYGMYNSTTNIWDGAMGELQKGRKGGVREFSPCWCCVEW